MSTATFTTNVKVRSEPSLASLVLMIAQKNSIAWVQDWQPIIKDGFTWWQLRHQDGTIGWSAQKLLNEHLFLLGYEKFNEALDFTLSWEGEYVFNPQDPGGETKYGISKRSYPLLDIFNLTLEQARNIYYNDYWLPTKSYAYSYPKYICLFDIGVLCGVNRSRVLEPLIVPEILSRQIEFFIKLNTFDTFGRGWLRRTAALIRLIK